MHQCQISTLCMPIAHQNSAVLFWGFVKSGYNEFLAYHCKYSSTEGVLYSAKSLENLGNFFSTFIDIDVNACCFLIIETLTCETYLICNALTL